MLDQREKPHDFDQAESTGAYNARPPRQAPLIQPKGHDPVTAEPSNDTPSIDINGQSYQFLCGFCETPIAFRSETDVETGEAGCAECDNFAEIEEVAKVAVSYAIGEGQRALNRLLQESARKSNATTLAEETPLERSHAFIVDLQI